MIFDLHNDFLLKFSQNKIEKYLNSCALYTQGLCGVIWTTELKNSLKI